MNKRKGFTLIELLTVIAILAIILLIAAPTILNVLDKAKKNTFKNQVLLYVEGLKQQVSLSLVNESDMDITLPGVGDSTVVNMSDIPMDQDAGISGSIRIENDNGKYKYILVDVSNDSYKVNKEVEANILTINEIVKADGSSTPKPITYKAYSIGDSVTLKDNTTWYVIEDSSSSSSIVTLFASQNIKHDAPGTDGGNVTGWTVTRDEYKIVFDEANSNIYANSTIKKFIDGSVKNYINNSLTSNGGTNINGIRLLTVDEYNALDSSITNNSTDYWTMTPDAFNSNSVYDVRYDGSLDYLNAYRGNSDGARPVIVTNKSNIK